MLSSTVPSIAPAVPDGDDVFHRLIRNNPFGMYLVDADFRLREVSAGAQSVFQNVRPLLGRDFAVVLRSIWTEPFATEAIDRFRHTLASGEPYASPSTVERRHDVAALEAYDWRIERVDLPDGRHGVVCYFYDLSERRRFEAALARTAERLRLAQEAGGLGIHDYDVQSGRIEWDARLRQLWGVDDDATIDFGTFIGGVHPDDRAAIQATVAAAMDPASRGRYEAEYRVVNRRDGTVRWIGSTGRVTFEAGRATRLVGTVQDVTERKRAEHRLRESEAYFRLMANSAPAMLWVTGADGRCSFISSGWCEYTGQSEQDALGFGWLEMVHEEDRPAASRAFQEANAARCAFSLDHRVRSAEGDYRWVIDSGRPRFDEAGTFLGYIGSVIDVHDRREAEQALRESEERFRALADNMSQFAWMADEAGEIFWYNKRWYDYTGTTLEQVRGWGWQRVHHPDHVARVVESIQHAWSTGHTWEETFPLRGADGRYRWFLSRAVPIRDAAGRITRWFGTNTDVTEQRAAEAALLDADRRKDEFLAVLAHELRNPLAPLRNALQLLQVGGHDAAIVEQARGMMERQVAHMVRLIDDLLDVSRITHGKLELRRQRMDLTDAVRSALEASRPLLDAARHEVTVTLPDGPLPVEGDPVRLAQVFANLLNNAARYTPPGGHVKVRAGAEAGRAVVAVEDDGIGIPPEMLERVFEPFLQVTGGERRAHGGLGLGLALARELIELHGGAIRADSAGPGAGSRFIVTLPAAPAAIDAAAPAAAETSGTGAANVLVVDDNRDAADSLAMLLRALGHAVRTAYDGAAALEIIGHTAPDVVLMDIGMPGMDGYAVARELRRRGHRDLRLYALSGYGQDHDRRESERAGFDAHLVKPLAPGVLERLLDVRGRD